MIIPCFLEVLSTFHVFLRVMTPWPWLWVTLLPKVLGTFSSSSMDSGKLHFPRSQRQDRKGWREGGEWLDCNPLHGLTVEDVRMGVSFGPVFMAWIRRNSKDPTDTWLPYNGVWAMGMYFGTVTVGFNYLQMVWFLCTDAGWPPKPSGSETILRIHRGRTCLLVNSLQSDLRTCRRNCLQTGHTASSRWLLEDTHAQSPCTLIYGLMDVSKSECKQKRR